MARRRPSQKRSEDTVDIILEATAQVLKDVGPQNASTNRIAERAGVSVGTIYQYFPNKEALFVAVSRRLVSRLETALLAHLPAFAAEEPTAAIEGFLRAIWAINRADPQLYQIIGRLELPNALALLEAFEARTEGMLAGVLVSRLRPGEDPLLVAKVLVRTVAGLVQHSIRRDPDAFHDERLAVELVTLVSGYLLPKARPLP